VFFIRVHNTGKIFMYCVTIYMDICNRLIYLYGKIVDKNLQIQVL
jgi:hypothetical protein